MRTRDGRQARVAISRDGFAIRRQALELALLLEDLARAHPLVLARVMHESEEAARSALRDAGRKRLDAVVARQLREFEALARRVLGEVGS